ncbi:MAG: glycosyltransferase family 2 protein [Candidatus Thiodiazotropha sp.]
MNSVKEYSVSVIIPTHNRPLLARRAVASALAQTINNLEVIVVDDCSDIKLNVHGIIQSIKDDRVTYRRHNVCKGPSATRNTGIDLAKGDFIAFLDDDDVWLETKLEKQIGAINNYAASLCGFFTQYGSTVVKGCKELGYKEFKYERDFAINSGLVVKSNVIQNIRYDENLRVGEDLDFVFKILQKGNIAYLSKPQYFVNLGSHGRITTENKDDQDSLENRLLFVKKNMDVYGKFWGNYTMASILLKNFKYEKNKMIRLLKTAKRCGLTASSFAVYRKLIKKYT